ncbi:MAG: hypothetical protein WC565_08950 [Parcubacteria group bacterium]
MPQPTRINDDEDGTWEWRRAGEYYDDLVLYTVIKDANPLGVPGDVLVCKEAWLFTGLRTVYRATDPQWGEICEWNPASTMPRRAVRFRPVVCEAGVMRIDDITYGQCIDMGLDMSGVEYEPGWDTAPLVRYWNRRFRKYPWEDNPWCWFARVERENDHA